MSQSSIPRSLRDEVFRRDGGRCRYCLLRQFGQAATFHVNHIVPRAKGGTTTLENLVLQCPYCSLHKADKTEAVDPLSGETAGIFDPLRADWFEHFELRRDAQIIGKTPSGRATVAALAMNDTIPRFARACEMALGLLES